jgi:oxygen-independent coproporphyrinogen-3 oxidase
LDPDESRHLAGLYIHVPFCARVCPYCDFAVTTGDREKQHRFVEHLVHEIDLYAGQLWRFDTIYLGGGTPSRLPLEELTRVVEHARGRFSVAPAAGMSLEVNPEDVETKRISAWRSLGFDFISLGVQSFTRANLEFLGRRHSVSEAKSAVERTLEAGFPTVSLDLIYGLPDQSNEDWLADLEQAVSLKPNHLSCYQLTVHEKTVFGLRKNRGQLREADEERQAELFELTHRFLLDAGFEGYEVSNFASSPRHRSRHNRKYWDHTPYLGLGPSAHSFDGRSRWWNVRRVGAWESELDHGRHPVDGREQLTSKALALEAVMLGLRTRDGVDLSRLMDRYGLDLRRSNEKLIRSWLDEGLLEEQSERLRPTIRGMAVAEGFAAALNLGP